MSRLVDYLIDQARRESENEEFSETSGISDTEFLQYLNDGQHRLQAVIIAQHPTVFVKEKLIDTSRSVESYDLPSDMYLENKITQVDYSFDLTNWYDLRKSNLKKRYTEIDGYPRFYIRRSGKILLSPTPQGSGQIRLNYPKRIAELDKRRGSVESAVLDNNTNEITSLTLNITTDTIDSDDLAEHHYICIVDKEGNTQMNNIPFDSIDTTTGIVTITSGFTFETGETIEVGDYLVGGKDTTTHPEFPRSVERYLIKYCVWKILKRDSSVDYAEAQEELMAMENDIIASYADISDDVEYIPILNDWDF